MQTVSLGSCDGCGEPIFPHDCYVKNDIYTCNYCREQYRLNKFPEKPTRISPTQLPLTCDVVVSNFGGKSIKTVKLYDVAERFRNAVYALDDALREYKEACQLYESARPRKEINTESQ